MYVCEVFGQTLAIGPVIDAGAVGADVSAYMVREKDALFPHGPTARTLKLPEA